MTSLYLELTTRCNFSCDFCTRPELIRSGKRPSMDMPLDQAKHILDHMANVAEFLEQDFENIDFVGVGEPMMYPYLLQVIDHARERFPHAKLGLNTNGSIPMYYLIGKLDWLIISMCFPTRWQHGRHIKGERYDQVSANVQMFLNDKKDSLPVVKLHIFDTSINKALFPLFYLRWKVYLGKDDFFVYHPYEKRVGQPCLNVPQPGNIQVDVQGNIFSSCLGCWYPLDETKPLQIGRVEA